MDSNRVRRAAEWFYSNIFRDEVLQPRQQVSEEKVPSLIRTARSLDSGTPGSWQSREAVFLKQGKLLANYEDDYVYEKPVLRYFPTYQSLTDPELRGYFSWRTKLRKGEVQKTSLSFAFLYIYELINQIGVSAPLDGYQKLLDFRDAYGALDEGILAYLDRWLTDYVVYYELDPNLLAGSKRVLFDRGISVLDLIREQEEVKVMYAIKQLAPKWLSRSKFYAANQSDCDAVIVRVLRRVSDHYATRTKKTMVEQFFGTPHTYQIRLFDTAVFWDSRKRKRFEYAVDERCIYRCQNGLWTVTRHPSPLRPNEKLEDILKTIDAVMREEYSYKYPVKYETETKWLIKLIREETQTFLAAKKAHDTKKITIDYSQLTKIRQEAAITQEKLTVDEDEIDFSMDGDGENFVPEPETQETSQSVQPGADCPLTETEYRLLHCLLYGRSISWVHKEGFMLSVLSDSINEKLYDIFQDSVIDDTPELIEDYIEDLKEMVKP